MSPLAWTALLAVFGGGIAGACLVFGMSRERRWRLIADLPTSKTTGVFIGLVELKGSAELDAPLQCHLCDRMCVWHRWTIAEHWSKTETETYRDAQGRSRTRTKHSSGWTTVDSGGDAVPFRLRDDHGAVQVIPDGADVDGIEVLGVDCDSSHPLYYGKGPPGAIMHSDHRRRFTESAIPLGQQLYVLGQARQQRDVVAAEIARDPHAPLFVVSCRDERAVANGWFWSAIVAEGLGLAIALGVGWFVANPRTDGVLPPSLGTSLAVAAGAYLSAWLAGWTWMAYNSLVSLRQRVRQGWSNIDVQLKRRNDLIPNLAALVQSLAGHERETQETCAALRAQLLVTPPGRPGPDVAPLAGSVIALAERYPTLTAQPGYAQLMRELADTEERIALARAYFNDIATEWNTRLERIPDRFIAALGAMQPQALL